MTHRLWRYGLTFVVAAAAAWWFPSNAATQEGRGGGAGAAMEKARVAPTPKTPDGKPDLSGRWGGGGGGGGGGGKFDERGNYDAGRAEGYRKGNPVNGERDAGLNQRFFVNVPEYKPEFWDKVDYLDNNGNVEDSNFHCMPAGVPRMGPPVRILQTPVDVVFLYQQKNTYRVIPIDGRPHDKVNSMDQTYLGDSIGRWEGDTLVVDVVGFNDETWLGWPGYFHTNKMRVEERLRREGNVLYYQATVHDPDVLAKPWVMDPRTFILNTNRATQIEDPPCIESDGQNLYTRERG